MVSLWKRITTRTTFHKPSHSMFFFFQRFNNKNLTKLFTLVGIVRTNFLWNLLLVTWTYLLTLSFHQDPFTLGQCKSKKKFFSPQYSFTLEQCKSKKKFLFNLNDYGSEESWKERACYEVYLKTQNLGAKSKANNFKVKFRKKITLNKSKNFSSPLILKSLSKIKILFFQMYTYNHRNFSSALV